MEYLHEQNEGNEAFEPVLSYTLNPKCVSMGELYGEYNTLTAEWKDGLASTLIRSAVGDASPVRKWVVFDGPVDAMWIENMNTVKTTGFVASSAAHSMRLWLSDNLTCPSILLDNASSWSAMASVSCRLRLNRVTRCRSKTTCCPKGLCKQ